MAYLRSDGKAGVRFKEVYQGIERDSMAYKLMSSMGWQEGEGLGAQKQGINVHVKAHKKFDNTGVGMKEQAARSQDWTLDMCKFSAVLRGLKEISAPEDDSSGGTHGRAQQSDQPASAEPSKESTARKKKKRARDDDESAVAATAAVTAACAASAASPVNEPNQPQKGKHAAMYSRRKQQKMVKGYSATDIAAILGHSPADVAPALAVAPAPAAPQQDVAKRSARKSEEAAECIQQVVQQTVTPSSRQQTTSAPAPSTDIESWWISLFRRGESTGAGSSAVAPVQRAAFSEQDQSALYASAHADKSQGRKGLGRKNAKVRASEWKGKKVSFDSDEDGEAEQPRVEDAEGHIGINTGDRDHDKLPGGTVVVWGGRRPQWFAAQSPSPAPQPQPAAPEPAPATAAAAAAVCVSGEQAAAEEPLSLTEKQRRKCLKVACKMLKKCQGGIKLKEVVDSAVAALKVSHGAHVGKLRSKVRTVIKQGDGWSIQGGTLTAAIAVQS